MLCVSSEPCSVMKLFLLSLAEHGWISTPHRATEVLTQLALYSTPPGGGLTPIEPPPLSVYVTPPNGGSSRRKKKKQYDPSMDHKESALSKEDEKSTDDSVSADGEAFCASGLVSTMTETEFVQLSSMIPSFSDSKVHCTESLQGKQKNCVLCKYLGRKTNEGLLKVRTRAKCNACDTPLCKGPPRNCFRDFHELYKKFKFPDLKWSHASVYQYPGRGVNARFIISPDINDPLQQQWGKYCCFFFLYKQPVLKPMYNKIDHDRTRRLGCNRRCDCSMAMHVAPSICFTYWHCENMGVGDFLHLFLYSSYLKDPYSPYLSGISIFSTCKEMNMFLEVFFLKSHWLHEFSRYEYESILILFSSKQFSHLTNFKGIYIYPKHFSCSPNWILSKSVNWLKSI